MPLVTEVEVEIRSVKEKATGENFKINICLIHCHLLYDAKVRSLVLLCDNLSPSRAMS